ncbi:MAG: NAD(P)H-dependent oxidoreductase [Acidimicrobiia bacterium]|nr:NAD(P)H-dependent oxidoreductase [Acidimicrobiia bacterium]MBT8191776.1 NAD(P)H-dependent oxidoreductase [Acidimicrobiia bacterium]MBT8246985.1 NAD(P)H-dependent oxidoreductase [Acidimicrobiia bacterium]NNF89400.1 NAD(P)H-dependent oxidoreductase [Acidimicrobiia bacterium]NNJ46911.1 NAD(P)H-dependent oxidoreductase [Acidimicrobiia bacterium]
MSTIHIVGLSGSLRRDSYNTALLRAAQSVLPDDAKLEIIEYADVPVYNHDVEKHDGYPESVVSMREKLGRADAILFAAPEYNWSIPGVMKNAIDWASRGSDSPLDDKPAAIMGAGGRLGTAYAQQHLRQILMHNDMRVVTRPNVLISHASKQFDEELNLVNERHLDQIKRLLVALVEETERARQ